MGRTAQQAPLCLLPLITQTIVQSGVWWPWLPDAVGCVLCQALCEGYPDDHQYYHDIATQWRMWGITPDKRVVFYCGTGWRASEACFYAYLMGWAHIAVYNGGWWAWVQNPANPIAVGDPDNIL